jgi:RNA polymerase sigma-70 factor (ECF subfamily)
MLDTTTASTSALQRARRTLGDGVVSRRRRTTRPSARSPPGTRRPGGRDVEAIGYAGRDARYAMPPRPEWYAGRSDPRLPHHRAAVDRWRFVPTRANGQLAFGTYLWTDGALERVTRYLRGGEPRSLVPDGGSADVRAADDSPDAGGLDSMSTDTEQIRALIEQGRRRARR